MILVSLFIIYNILNKVFNNNAIKNYSDCESKNDCPDNSTFNCAHDDLDDGESTTEGLPWNGIQIPIYNAHNHISNDLLCFVLLNDEKHLDFIVSLDKPKCFPKITCRYSTTMKNDDYHDDELYDSDREWPTLQL